MKNKDVELLVNSSLSVLTECLFILPQDLNSLKIEQHTKLSEINCLWEVGQSYGQEMPSVSHLL